VTSPSVDQLLADLGVDAFVEDARHATLAREIAAFAAEDTRQLAPERLPRYGFLYETRGLEAYTRAVSRRSDDDPRRARTCFAASFHCWRALATLADDMSPADAAARPPDGPEARAGSGRMGAGAFSRVARESVASDLGREGLSAHLAVAVRLAVSGLIAERTAETRLELARFTIRSSAVQGAENGLAPRAGDLDWRGQVLEHVAGAFVLLVRKARGWHDVEQALDSVQSLRGLQQTYEARYLDGIPSGSEQTAAALELVGLYHVGQFVTITGEYLRDGAEASAQINARLDRHRERASAAFAAGRHAMLAHLGDLLWAGCRELVRNSLWTHVSGLGERVQQYARALTAKGRPNPVLELWPSQQTALRRNLLDPYKRAILVEMPTSAGKTLLAKFAIVQTKALNPHGTVIYVVPTRALVNQITLDLRADFRDLGLTVEQAVPAFELDPMEEQLLKGVADVLVTTPEKLDLLLRRDHPVTKEIALIVADEAHNIRDGARGARLELLLGMLKRDRPDARFLMLSPFLPNDRELVTWLGDDRALDPIKVDWKPSSKLVGVVLGQGRGPKRALMFETVPAADNVDAGEGLRVPLATYEGNNAKGRLTLAAVDAMRPRGAVLVLCKGAGTATSRATSIRERTPARAAVAEVDAVCHFLEAELGRPSTLGACIRHGVAFHHAGLSQEARWLVEGLIRDNHVDVVCGTTTLAQGVNFPITTVLIETLRKGPKPLTYEDFWNIAGRAGRALVDTVGVVAYPSSGAADTAVFQSFLQGEAREITSQLATLIDRADEIVANFSMNAVTRWPELGALMQFLAHAMRVAGSKDLADDVEDLLRASLVYHQAQRQSDDAARRLVKICRAYLGLIRGKPGVLALADQTGFSTPSVLHLQQRVRHSPELREVSTWTPGALFGPDSGPLANRIAAIGALPEMQLGIGTGGPFSAQRIAEILRDWVQGASLHAMAQKYPLEPEGDEDVADEDDRASAFSKYLFSSLLGKAAWGLGALESVCLAGQEPGAADLEAAYVPSMVFFGVKRREAVWLRMVGVPRMVADGLGELWAQTGRAEPTSYGDLRQWVSSLADVQWRAALPKDGPLTPADARVIWRQFAGTP
jgi:hypothetical protein